MRRFPLSMLVALAGVTAASGCISYRTSHGYLLERGEELVTGKPGFDTKDSVIARYGEPSIVGAFDEDSWYYLASRDSARAFFRPQTKQRDIVAFHFDEAGVVKEVENLTLDDGLRVNLASRVTPTRGKELGFWEQLLGNVGRLPAPQEGQDPTTGRQGPQ